MDVQVYKARLLDLERSLADRATRENTRARELTLDSPADTGDASMADEQVSENFGEAELDAATLQQVRDALRRIEDGSFGRCLVDGGQIEPNRLAAIPWAAYCIKHQTLLEAGSPSKPTL